jgi:hypothetical protein
MDVTLPHRPFLYSTFFFEPRALSLSMLWFPHARTRFASTEDGYYNDDSNALLVDGGHELMFLFPLESTAFF